MEYLSLHECWLRSGVAYSAKSEKIAFASIYKVTLAFQCASNEQMVSKNKYIQIKALDKYT